MDRRSTGRAGRLGSVLSPGIAVAAMLVVLLAGCGRSSSPPTRTGPTRKASKVTLMSCGSSRTAANVPVDVEVAQGSIPCATALSVEREYALAIRSGKAPGNGGGGPVTVAGWVCQGFATPVVLKTGKASKCEKDGEEILAVLPLPSASAGSSG